MVGRATLSASIGLALAALVEGAVLPSAALFEAVGLGELFGAACGMALGLLYALTWGLSRRAQSLIWSACGLLVGVDLALELRAPPKLHGPHWVMAAMVLVVAPTLGALLGLLLLRAQTLTASPGLRVDRFLAAWAALGVVAILSADVACGALALLVAYPAAKAAILVSAWACASAASGVVLGVLLQNPRTARQCGALWCLIVALQLPTLGRMSSDQARLLLERPHTGAWLELIRNWTDFDRDGASGWFAGGDCAPFDPRIAPTRQEIPGNGVDDNCSYGDAKANAPPHNPSAPALPADALARHVLLITIDTLRADHMGVYGYHRPTTPHLDAWARQARRFEHAYTSGGWTCLALHSLFAGLYPRRLTWEAVGLTTEQRIILFPSRGAGAHEELLAAVSALAASPSPNFPQVLRTKAVATGAIVSGEAPARLFSHRQWLGRTFDHVTLLENDHDQGVTDAALRLASELGDAPWFIWVHYFEPHYPPGQHPEVPDFGHDIVSEYDRDVAYSDLEVGRLLDGIEQQAASTLVIVTADHGEAFEGGLPTHGLDLRPQLLRIPLLIAGPGMAPGVERAPASLVDLAPTILAAMAAPPLSRSDGVDLHQSPRADRIVFTDLWRRGPDGRLFLRKFGASAASGGLVYDQMTQTWRAWGSPVPALEPALGAYLEEPMQVEEVPQ